MMAKLFLHIGAHKTGTSYIQALFDNNRALLEEAGLAYPHIGPNNAHHALAARWIDVEGVPDTFWDNLSVHALWDRIIDTYAKAPGILFLSAENFSRIEPKELDFQDLARVLAPFDEVQVIMTVRQQVTMIPSLWAQLAKLQTPPRPVPFIARALETRACAGVVVDHLAVYQRLRQGFDPDQIHIFDYNQISHGPGGLAGAFLRHMGVDLDPARLDPPSRLLSHISPDPLALFMASKIMEGGPPHPMLVHLSGTALRKVTKDRPTTLLERKEFKKIRALFAVSNQELEDIVQPRQPGFKIDEGIMSQLMV